MDGTRIVLVRHGESRAQERRIVGGHIGCEGLSDLGRRQAAALRDRLAATGELGTVIAVYTSLMPRAVETAGILAPALGAPDAVQDCDFCEHHPGEGDGLTYDEFDRRWPVSLPWDPDARRDPGGETWTEMAARVARGLDGVVARHPGSTVVVVCHGGVVVHSMLRWLGLPSVTGEDGDAGRVWLDPVNTSLTEWRFGPSPLPFHAGALGVSLVRFNDHAHLSSV